MNSLPFGQLKSFLKILIGVQYQSLRRRDLVPLTGGVVFRIVIAPAVVFFFGDLPRFQLGGNRAPRGKHFVKLRCVASFVDMNAQMHLILTLAGLKTVAVFQREQRVHQSDMSGTLLCISGHRTVN